MRPVEVEIATRLAAPAAEVWAFAVSEQGINYELRPWLRMTRPRGLGEGATIDEVPLHSPLGRSWLLLGGVVPVDFDELRLVERGPGMRFVESSRLATAWRWRHEREALPRGASACELRDRLAFELRAPLAAVRAEVLAERVVRGLFTHRHRRLAERWGRP